MSCVIYLGIFPWIYHFYYFFQKWIYFNKNTRIWRVTNMVVSVNINICLCKSCDRYRFMVSIVLRTTSGEIDGLLLTGPWFVANCWIVCCYWSMFCCLLVHVLLLAGPWFFAYWSMVCCLLVHSSLLTGPWSVAYWSIVRCLLVYGLLLTGLWSVAYWSMVWCLLVHGLVLTGPWLVANCWMVCCY